MAPFLLSQISSHQTFCYDDYSILAYAIHQELIYSVNQKVTRIHLITRYSLFHPKSALHTSCLLFHIDQGKRVLRFCASYELWFFQDFSVGTPERKKGNFKHCLLKKLCKIGKWKQDFSMASPQDKRYISEKTYAYSTFIAQLCYAKFKFICKAYYATHVQKDVNSHWMSGYLGTY